MLLKKCKVMIIIILEFKIELNILIIIGDLI